MLLSELGQRISDHLKVNGDGPVEIGHYSYSMREDYVTLYQVNDLRRVPYESGMFVLVSDFFSRVASVAELEARIDEDPRLKRRRERFEFWKSS